METIKQVINWDECIIKMEHGEQSVDEAMANFNFFPQEFRPDSQFWNGMLYEEWKKYVMSDGVERPSQERKEG